MAWLAVGFLVMVGGAARLSVHESSCLWFDEVITLEEASRASFGETVRAKELHPPLVRVLSRASMSLAGETAEPRTIDLLLRLPSLTMGILAIVVVFLFARTLSNGSDLVGTVAAAAWALLPYGIWYSTEARFYAAMVLFSAWTIYALVLFRRQPDRPLAHAHLALPLALGCYTHYAFVFVFFLTALSVLPHVLTGPRRRVLALLPWLVAGLSFLPWLCYAVPRIEAEQRSWVDPLSQQLRNVPVSFITGRLGYYHLAADAGLDTPAFREAALLGAAVLLAAGIAVHLVRRRHTFGRLTAFVLLTSLGLTAFLHATFAETPLFHPKYLAFIYPFVCLALGELAAFLVGAGSALRRPPLLGLAAWLVVAVALSTTGRPIVRALAQVYERTLSDTGTVAHRQPYAGAVAWVAERRSDGDPLVVLDCAREYNQIALRHYGSREPLAGLRCDSLAAGDATLPAASGGPAFAVLTHWGSDETRRIAVDLLRESYGPVVEREHLAGIEFDILVLELGPPHASTAKQ